MRRQSYDGSYYEKIALGEGCGIAEHVTRMRESDAYADGCAPTPAVKLSAPRRRSAYRAFVGDYRASATRPDPRAVTVRPQFSRNRLVIG